MSQERKFLGQGQKPQRLSNIALVVYFLRALARPFFLSRVLWRPTRQTQKKRLCSQSKCSDESSITETFIDALPDSRKEHFILQCMEIYSRHQENYHLSLHPTYLAVSLVREKNSNDIAVRAVGQGSGFSAPSSPIFSRLRCSFLSFAQPKLRRNRHLRKLLNLNSTILTWNHKRFKEDNQLFHPTTGIPHRHSFNIFLIFSGKKFKCNATDCFVKKNSFVIFNSNFFDFPL